LCTKLEAGFVKFNSGGAKKLTLDSEYIVDFLEMLQRKIDNEFKVRKVQREDPSSSSSSSSATSSSSASSSCSSSSSAPSSSSSFDISSLYASEDSGGGGGGGGRRAESDGEEDEDLYHLPLKEQLARRRAQYKCGANFVTLETIPTWQQWFKTNVSVYKSEVLKAPPKAAPSLTINERISVWQGDITGLEIDCIVNAAQHSLEGGPGIDAAIHAAAGPRLKKECLTLGGCATGDAKITCGHRLPAEFVIHTVGPTKEDLEALSQCYINSLNIIKLERLKSVAFCCISTGVDGVPHQTAAKVAIHTVRTWLDEDDNYKHVNRVVFCVYTKDDLKIYRHYMPRYFPLP